MAADSLFSLDQLDPEARALAERAARAAGLSLEEWVTRAILRKTGGQAPPAPTAPTPIAPPTATQPAPIQRAPQTAAPPVQAPPTSPPQPAPIAPTVIPTPGVRITPVPPPAAQQPPSPAKERPTSAALSDKDLLAALSALGSGTDATPRPAAVSTPPAKPAPGPVVTPSRPLPSAKSPTEPEAAGDQRPAVPTKELEELKRALERIGSSLGGAAPTTPAPATPSETRATPSGTPARRFPTFSNTLRTPSEGATSERPFIGNEPSPSYGAEPAPKADAPKGEPEPNIAFNLEAALRAFPSSSPAAQEPAARANLDAGEPLELDQPLPPDEADAAEPARARASLLKREDEDDEGEPETERSGGGIFRRVLVILIMLVVLGGAGFAAYKWLDQGGGKIGISDLIDRVTSTTPPAPPPSTAAPANSSPATSAPAEATKPPETAPATGTPSASPATPPGPHSEAIPPAMSPNASSEIATAPAPGIGAAPSTEAPTTAPPATSAPGPPGQAPANAIPVPTPPPAAAVEIPKSKPPIAISSIDQLEDLAKKGNPHAQHDLATLYARGTEIPQDYKQAAHWFRESALQGVASSQYNLGVLYEQGLGIDKDLLEALLWYLSAAQQGYAPAQYNVGVAYADGKGVPRNYVEARKWFEKAATLGLARGAYNLGVLNELGLGAAVDLVDAYKWYKIALRGGEADTQRRIDDISKKMTPAQRADAERRYQVAAAKIPDKPAPFNEKTTGPPVARTSRPAASIDATVPTRNVGTMQAVAPSTTAPARAVESTGTSRSTVAEIQRLLGLLGYDPGSSDGQMTEQTASAIRAFQQEAGTPVDGKATPELLEQIRKLSGKS